MCPYFFAVGSGEFLGVLVLSGNKACALSILYYVRLQTLLTSYWFVDGCDQVGLVVRRPSRFGV